MVKVRGACDTPFWIYTGKRLNQLHRPRHRESNDVLVVDDGAVVTANAYIVTKYFLFSLSPRSQL